MIQQRNYLDSSNEYQSTGQETECSWSLIFKRLKVRKLKGFGRKWIFTRPKIQPLWPSSALWRFSLVEFPMWNIHKVSGILTVLYLIYLDVYILNWINDLQISLKPEITICKMHIWPVIKRWSRRSWETSRHTSSSNKHLKIFTIILDLQVARYLRVYQILPIVHVGITIRQAYANLFLLDNALGPTQKEPQFRCMDGA